MNQSTNFNFNLPEGNDLVNLLTQLIPNWNNLDTILKGIQDATFQNATETVALGVHAITRLNSDSKLLKWIATANFTAGDTFTVDGISTPAALPSGEALGNDAYITGAVVIAALNADESALTVYVTSGAIAVASDSERLGGELPSYYAKKTEVDAAQNTANAASQSVALKNLCNVNYDPISGKLYQVAADGTRGGEIVMGGYPDLNWSTPLHTFGTVGTYTATKDCYLTGFVPNTGVQLTLTINNVQVITNNYGSGGVIAPIKLHSGDIVATNVLSTALQILEEN